jgi:hypothetical protein
MNALLRSVIMLLWMAPIARASTVASFDDVQFWAGAGANRAAIAMDWDSSSPADTALVWGYRWDGTAKGEDMLRAALKADARLFAKLSGSGSLGFSVYGIGYDANGDGEFALSDGTQFDADGVAVTGLPDEDATPLDPDDWYREGWFTGVWSYSTASGNAWPEGWTQSRVGPSGRVLASGSWDAWTFTSPIVLDAFPSNPTAAEPPRSGADFDADGNVDGADFLHWQRGLGISSGAMPAQGDADGDGAVTVADLAAWRDSFRAAPAISIATASTTRIPEPATYAQLLTVLGLAFCHFNPGRKRS